MKHYDVIIVGAGAAGLMCAHAIQDCAKASGKVPPRTLLLEKMPRPARKVIITGKGRCNFSNLKNWNEFQSHVANGANALKSSFMAFPPEKVREFFEMSGTPTVLERGDRLFPASHKASDIVDALMRGLLAEIKTSYTVSQITREEERFIVNDEFSCSKLVITTGGLSYPATGSTGDGYDFAKALGHSVTPLFPTLTALKPKDESLLQIGVPEILTLENVSITLFVDGNEVQYEEGDLCFTNGGIEGPIGYKVSRKAVKAMTNGGKVSVVIDLKPAVSEEQLASRVNSYISSKLPTREILKKLLPAALHGQFASLKPQSLPRNLKSWKIDINGFVGWERAVVTAGGVNLKEINPKTLESKKVPGLYFAGEVLDIDCATGGYNLQTAFCTGYNVGQALCQTF